jgi:hypothetical protein
MPAAFSMHVTITLLQTISHSSVIGDLSTSTVLRLSAPVTHVNPIPISSGHGRSQVPIQRPRFPRRQMRMLSTSVAPAPDGMEERTFECLKCHHVDSLDASRSPQDQRSRLACGRAGKANGRKPRLYGRPRRPFYLVPDFQSGPNQKATRRLRSRRSGQGGVRRKKWADRYAE